MEVGPHCKYISATQLVVGVVKRSGHNHLESGLMVECLMDDELRQDLLYPPWDPPPTLFCIYLMPYT